MHWFWASAIAPLLDAIAARTVAEIGVDHGQTTRLLLERAKRISGGVVHAIDPAPGVDLGAAPPLRFHRERSHQAIPRIGPVDAVLIDGDHNWFTVLGELRLLADVSSSAGRPLPLVIAHDVGWPYGRRDMYYDPEALPDDGRHPAERSGMVPGRSELSPEGMNPWLWNATHEGGPRNGVLTAIEDFVATHDAPCELRVLEGFHGLGVLASRELIEATPALRAAISSVSLSGVAAGWTRELELARVSADLRAWNAEGRPYPPDADVARWGGPAVEIPAQTDRGGTG